MKPKNTNKIPRVLLINIFAKPNFISPSLIKLNDSKVYVEKVVKEPIIPIKISDLKFEGIIIFSDIPHKKPIKKAPNRLTIIVPQGKIPEENLLGNPETKCLNKAPIIPPIAIYSKFIIVFYLF